MDYSFIILIVSVFGSRWLLLRAFNKLTDEEKAKVLSGNIIRLSQITMATTILMVVVFYFMIVNYPQMYQTISISFFTILIMQRMIAYLITKKSMLTNNIPQTYINKYFLSWLITTVGVLIFIFLLVKDNFK
ncbi:hypothetical protein FRZ67_03355 [Panacibacter ginsenosidivorans]|uniref:Uncharacterized protein n=1 Tax=Panacibacter ginsenosidivorans TaxID=1813871 RepID=A0A5B8V4R6_9BACT|nr:hypothetical protein [Panacibacter ginsenosidivorans]QEC66384.1 hypothetical protein FRZ67_03355 [Panacibacter ginsenosidivorans]